MDSVHLVRQFNTIGTRLVVCRLDRLARPFRIDVGHDRYGEYFDLLVSPHAPSFDVLNVDPADRHLLLYAAATERFLCGHDERHWFEATIAERVTTVRDAKASLLPPALRNRALRLGRRAAFRRRNELFKRQGEWFFVPAARDLSGLTIHRHEPLQRDLPWSFPSRDRTKDRINGRGWAVLDDDQLQGHIFIHQGDDSSFTACRTAEGRAARRQRQRP